MQVVAVTRTLNEDDIIEPLIRHHAALVDHHIVLDNGSVDRTLEILHRCAPRTCRSRTAEKSVIFSETQFNTYLYKLAVSQFGADWVVYLDSDEFIDVRGIDDLRGYLAAVPADYASVGARR